MVTEEDTVVGKAAARKSGIGDWEGRVEAPLGGGGRGRKWRELAAWKEEDWGDKPGWR